MRKALTRTGAIGLTLGVTLTVGVAFAAWTSSGSGSGTAQSTTSEDSEIVAAAYAADLYPGADSTVTVTIDNPNDYPVVVTSISGGESSLVENSEGAADDCAAATVTSDGKSLSTGVFQSDGSSVVIAAGGEGTFELDTHMIADPTDSCKSTTFTLPLTASLQSAAS